MGGAETYAWTVASALADRGHEVVVLTDGADRAERADRADGTSSAPRFRVHRLTGYLELLADPSKLRWEQLYFGLLPETAAALGAWGPDIVLANSLETTVLGRVVAEEFTVPLVGAYHEHAPQQEPFGTGRLDMVYRFLRPDLVLAGSRFYQERAVTRLGGDRVRLIHHGVDTGLFHPAVDGAGVRARYGVGPGDLFVVSAGRLKPRKGHLELVRAVARLDRTDVRLLIAGSVSSASVAYAEELRRAVEESGLGGRVTIDRSLGHRDMPAVLAAADVVAQPSHEEGLGLSVLEAMSSGRPVVTCSVPGIREILSSPDLAVLAPPGEPAALAKALSRCLDDEDLRASLARRGREHVLRHFSQQRMIDATEAELLRLAVGR
ncbi:glycosyltransferase family 4 protein [Streptomyces sp. NPDC059989]|uniref:glycosyltransferase family 4 protein n=1 Tax=Streptomyces sp. NPDC059989 TaxID=3347026 RepID=UPI0036CB0710